MKGKVKRVSPLCVLNGFLSFLFSLFSLVRYVIFEVPSNLMLKKATPSRWISRIVVSWGIVTTCIVFVNSFAGLMVCRALLGVMEAGFFPGMIFYLTFWYKKEELAVRQSWFFTATACESPPSFPFSVVWYQFGHLFLSLADDC